MAKETVSETKKIRTRFAPSPTGPLHMGNARTALFNYLFAKKEMGDFILRIEDTDKERSKPEWERDVLESLKWLGIEWDEGPIADAQVQSSKFKIQNYKGEYGPYRESEKGNIYKKYLQQLLDQGKAYWCFCTPDELEAQKQYQMSIGQAPRYSGKCRTLTAKEKEGKLKKGRPAVMRFVVESKLVTFEDLIRGKIQFDTALIGDIVIARDLASPLYNFAVVIDDYEMRISHVIRGEDHISNTPKQILLQEAFGFPRPAYAHLPLLLGEDRTKLSKRHGDNSVTRFQKEGYLPEAVVNFLVLLGWNPGDEREIFSLQSLLKEFSLERIQKGGAVFNIRRLDWINGFYIRQKSPEKLAELCMPYLIEAGFIEEKNGPSQNGNSKKLHLVLQRIPKFIVKETGGEISMETIQKIVVLYQERLKKLSEIGELTDFFFKKQLTYPKELLRWKDAPDDDIQKALDTLEQILSPQKSEDWTKDNLAQVLLGEADKAKDRGYLLWPLRVALTGKQASAGPFEIVEILEKEKTLERLQQAKEILKQ